MTRAAKTSLRYFIINMAYACFIYMGVVLEYQWAYRILVAYICIGLFVHSLLLFPGVMDAKGDNKQVPIYISAHTRALVDGLFVVVFIGAGEYLLAVAESASALISFSTYSRFYKLVEMPLQQIIMQSSFMRVLLRKPRKKATKVRIIHNRGKIPERDV